MSGLTLQSVLALIEPLLLGEFDGAAMTELNSLAANATSPDVKVMLTALAAAIKVIGDYEIPKI